MKLFGRNRPRIGVNNKTVCGCVANLSASVKNIMTKNVSRNNGQASTQSAPLDDWQADLGRGDGSDELVRHSKPQSSKTKQSNQDKVTNRHESSQERRERRLRERREREAVETERRERERDFAKKRHASVSRYKPRKPPVGYRDPNEACRQAVPGQVRDERRKEMRALMNCIAFDPPSEDAIGSGNAPAERGRAAPRVEEMDNSLSSDTTSDITDVTPRSSSSGCSSMSKQSTTPERTPGQPKRAASKRSKSEGRYPRKGEEKRSEKKNVSPEPDVNGNINTTEQDPEEMRYLQEAFEDFDLDEESSDFATSIISGLSEERRAKCSRKNMTFTNDQLREIERVNLILLKKIMAQKKPRTNGSVVSQPLRKTSSAINRARTEKNIEKDNMVLLRKLQAVKGTTGSVTRKPTAPPAVC